MSPRIATYYRFLREHSLLETVLSWMMILAMTWVIPAALWRGDWPLAVMATIAVAVSLLPAILQRNYRTVFPWFLEFLLVLQLHLHTFWGVWLRYYDSQRFQTILINRLRRVGCFSFRFFSCSQLIFLICAVLWVPVQPAAAVPVNYFENISGDLPDNGAPLPTFALDVGVNSVSGRFGEDQFTIDFDSFAFTVPAGAELIAGQVTLADLDLFGDIVSIHWDLRSGSANIGGGTVLQPLLPNSPGIDTITTVPLGPNVYNITHRSFSAGGMAPYLADYTFTFELRGIVPEPASAGMLLIGAAAMLSCRARRN